MRVQPKRAAWIAGLAAAAVLFGCYGVWHVPDGVVRMLGGATGVERTGGVRVRYQPPPGQAEAVARLLGDEARGLQDELVLLEYPRLSAADEPELRAMLEHGGLRLREVMDGTEYAASLFSLHSDAERGGPVTAEVDQWTPEGGGARRMDYYLSAPTRQALEQAIAAAADRLSPPQGSEIGYEEEVATLPSEWNPAGRPVAWRTYVLGQRDELDSSAIEHAALTYDPNTARPLVLITLTEAGGLRFCELTSRLAGSKLAILMGDKIVSAPIINGPICGGRLTITPGGSTDPAQLERDARTLAGLMTRAALPRGGLVVSLEEVAPASQAGVLLLARGLLALAGGALVGLTLLLLVRWAQPRWPAPAPRWTGSFPWKRLATTALAPVALLAGARLPLPGVNLEALGMSLNLPPGALPSLHVTSLGIMPVLSAFAVVEVVALAVPKLRWRRHDPAGRMGLGRAVAAVTIAFALVQGWFVAQYLTSLNEQAGPHAGVMFQVGVATSLACGTLLLAAVAGLINEHGLGNGYEVLATSGALIGLGEMAQDGKLTSAQLPAGLALATTIALTAVLLRWRVDSADRADSTDRAAGAGGLAWRVPTSGLAPLAQGGGLLLALGGLASVGLGRGALMGSVERLERALASPWAVLALTLGLAVLWSWLQARPALLATQATAAGLPPPSQLAWKRAALISAVASGAAVVLYQVVPEVNALASAATVMLATATVMDMVADARALRAQLVPAAVLHQVQRAGVVEHVLAQAGIPCHLRGAHLRTLLAFFGPHVPVTVLVPAEHGETARALLAPLSARPGEPGAPAPDEPAEDKPVSAPAAAVDTAEGKPVSPDDVAATATG